jgi:hypothetical protein
MRRSASWTRVSATEPVTNVTLTSSARSYCLHRVLTIVVSPTTHAAPLVIEPTVHGGNRGIELDSSRIGEALRLGLTYRR